MAMYRQYKIKKLKYGLRYIEMRKDFTDREFITEEIFFVFSNKNDLNQKKEYLISRYNRTKEDFKLSSLILKEFKIEELNSWDYKK